MFDALVLAASPHANVRVLGLTLAERGRRIASKAGARRVLVVDGDSSVETLEAWSAEAACAAPACAAPACAAPACAAPACAAPGGVDLLIIRAGDQVVHTSLVEPLLRASGARRLAVGPDGDFAGAILAVGDAAREAIAEIAAGPAGADARLAARWAERIDATRVTHGEIARHAATTAAERAGAAKLLLRLLVKPEDAAITRLVYRPISRPMTRLLLRTPVTPNQVSIVVGILGLLGCWFTAQPGQTSLIIGAGLVLFAGFLDGCDGEIARLRLTSSKIGAWLDTVVDELTTTVYFVAIGYHAYVHHPDLTWIAPSIVGGLICYLATVYVIYYFLIVVTKTGNSQHYVGDLEEADGALRPRHRAPTAPPWVRKLGGFLLLVVRRDFINLGAFAITFLDGYFFIYLTMLAGGVVTAAIVIPEHVKLRGQLRTFARRGITARYLSS